MKEIKEDLIDQMIEEIDGSPEFYNQAIADLKEQQPSLLAYMVDKDGFLFTKEERSYLLFIGMVTWRSTLHLNPDLPIFTEEEFSEIEEKNWSALSEVKAKTFRDRMDIFFTDYPQEDLLAFAEDLLTYDEANDISNEAREYLFVSSKTIIDVLCRSLEEQ